MKDRKDFRVAAIFDTETTNIGEGAETRAYPILYIFNDMRNTSVEEYNPDADDVRFYRHTDEALMYIDDLIAYVRYANAHAGTGANVHVARQRADGDIRVHARSVRRRERRRGVPVLGYVLS